MSGTLPKLIDRLSEASELSGIALEGVGPSQDFFEKESAKEEIFKLFDRSEYVKSLHDLENKPHKAKERMLLKSPVEFMAGLERDVRARFGSRIDNYRSAALSKRMPTMFFERYRRFIESMEQ